MSRPSSKARIILAKSRKLFNSGELIRPDIFQYHQYRLFLKDWLAYLRATDNSFSMKALAEKIGMATGYMPMVLSGKRTLTRKALDKLILHLRLQASEQTYLENLLQIESSNSQEAKLLIFDRIKRSSSFQKHNPVAAELLEYMSSWYNIAIREMTSLPDFKPEAEWIQQRLNFSVSLKDIQTSLEFLSKNGYINIGPNGSVAPPKENLKAAGEIYWAALTTYHRQMFKLAAESIDNTPSEQRNLTGYSFALNEECFAQVRAVLERALGEIKEIEKKSAGNDQAKPDSVYHVELALFPLSKKGTV